MAGNFNGFGLAELTAHRHLQRELDYAIKDLTQISGKQDEIYMHKRQAIILQLQETFGGKWPALIEREKEIYSVKLNQIEKQIFAISSPISGTKSTIIDQRVCIISFKIKDSLIQVFSSEKYSNQTSNTKKKE